MSTPRPFASPEAVFVCEGLSQASTDIVDAEADTNDETNPFEGATQVRNATETSGPGVAQFSVSQGSVLDFEPLSGVLANPHKPSQLRHDFVPGDNEATLPDDRTVNQQSNVDVREEHSVVGDDDCSPVTPQTFPLTQILSCFDKELNNDISDQMSQTSGADPLISSLATTSSERFINYRSSQADQDIDDNDNGINAGDDADVQMKEAAKIIRGCGDGHQFKDSSTQDSRKS